MTPIKSLAMTKRLLEKAFVCKSHVMIMTHSKWCLLFSRISPGSTQFVLAMSLSNACSSKCSVAQTNFTILINHKKLPAFSCVISPVFYTLFPQTSVRMAKVLSSYRFVYVFFVVVVLVNVQFSFAVFNTSHFCFVHYVLVFSSPFSLGNLHFETSWKFFPFLFTVI